MKSFFLAVFLLLSFCTTGCLVAKGDNDKPFSDYLTPIMYGAVGDGQHDDTDALREALYESNIQGKVLYFPSGYHFKVTGTLNYYDEKYQSYTLNMMGCNPIKEGSYTVKEYGGITVEKGVSLFMSATFGGSLERVCITGKRNSNVRFFDQCDCKGLVINGCNIACFEVMFYDTKVHRVSQITQNKFLSVCYFSKNEYTSSGLTDSTISFNYINGGRLREDNSCFEWAYYNGSIVSNNFLIIIEQFIFLKPTESNPLSVH